MTSAVKNGCRLLTPRQSEIYLFLEQQVMKGLPPTIREIGTEFGITSPNGVMCHLEAIEKKGFIRRDKHLSRAIELVNNPHDILKETCRKLVKLSKSPVANSAKIEKTIKEIGQLV